jgi:hypothetical protein
MTVTLVAADVRPVVLLLFVLTVLLDKRVLCARWTAGLRRGDGGWAGKFIFSDNMVELGSCK